MFEQTFKNIDDVLWKEAGCTTELDYTEQTSWILFLKYLDDLERSRAMEAELVGKAYSYIIAPEHVWSRWAAPKKKGGSFDHDTALTGDDLIDYVNRDLFPYLQGFKQRATSPNTIEYKIGEIFGEIKNKFQSGYSLRDALELVDELRFQSQKEKPRALTSLRSQDQKHGQRWPERRRVLHPASADPRDDRRDETENWRTHL
jgi:type I restriction enzyme M protein